MTTPVQFLCDTDGTSAFLSMAVLESVHSYERERMKDFPYFWTSDPLFMPCGAIPPSQGRLKGRQEAKLFGSPRGLCAVVYVELLVNIGGVVLHRLVGDEKMLADLLV
jgi:hypothetical protein